MNCEYGVPLWSAEIIIALQMYNDIELNIAMPYNLTVTITDIMTVLIFSNDVIWLFYGFGDCQNHVLTFKSLSTLLIDKKLETALFNFLCKSNK